MAGSQPVGVEFNAWNPGIESTLPVEFLPLSTMFRAEHVTTSIAEAQELSDFTGLAMPELVRLRAERLVVHELLIRVSADIYVSDGTRYGDLGVNFRNTVSMILDRYIEPEMASIKLAFEDLQQRVEQYVSEELDSTIFKKETEIRAGETPRSGLFKLFRRKKKAPKKNTGPGRDQSDHQLIIEQWTEKTAKHKDDWFLRSIYRQLARMANAIVMRHGRLIGDRSLLIGLASGFVCNDYGSDFIGEQIQPLIDTAVEREGLRVFPPQQEPVIFNIKGASAAGKSTMRPLQKKQTERLGLDWRDFALISPDIWRKYLLDYDSLGEARMYAGTLSGEELPIIDRKLDRYIRRKARRGHISHMLIDRFRFDSFAPGTGMREGSNLLTRFGHTIYLTFMITPPEATVERAWQRGLKYGRYKSVDDLLDHNIEAYRGIPVLFFTWVMNREKTVHFEFLDNSVEYGQKPRTIAFGSNAEMFILDFKCMFDIVRYTRLDIEARSPAELYPDSVDLSARANTDFLVECTRKLSKINFVDCCSRRIYAVMESGKITAIDRAIFKQLQADSEISAGFEAVAHGIADQLEDLPEIEALPLPDHVLQHIMGDICL